LLSGLHQRKALWQRVYREDRDMPSATRLRVRRMSMRPRATLARLSVLAALSVTVLAGAPTEGLRGRVVVIADGDTITVLDAEKRQHRVRLNGIDAPELGQPFSQVSKAHLSSLVFEREVVVMGRKVDRYGRLIGTVMVGGTNTSLEQLTAGLAWFYRTYTSDVPQELRAAYDVAEREARAAKRGLWVDAQPQAPWEHRRQPLSAGGPPALAGASSPIVGNRSSKVYHLATCPDFGKVAEQNRVPFATEAAAVAAGYRKAGNCSFGEYSAVPSSLPKRRRAGVGWSGVAAAPDPAV